MFTLANLKPAKGSTKKRKRVGRGDASKSGTYSGRGLKGQRSRSGGKFGSPKEGGRMPLVRQLPKKKGFTSIYRSAVAINLDTLEKEFKKGDMVNYRTLVRKGILDAGVKKFKILARGTIAKPLIMRVANISATAKEAIEKAGGKVFVPQKNKKEQTKK